MGKQINLYLELQMARAKTRQISVPEYDQIRVCLNAFKIWVGEESMIDSISPDKWEAWYVHLLNADISTEYKKKQFRHARNFLMWMAEKGLIQPALNLHARRYRFTGGHKKVPTIPVDEVGRATANTQGVLQLHLLLFLNCGMTQQDVSDLHPGEWTGRQAGSHGGDRRRRKWSRRRLSVTSCGTRRSGCSQSSGTGKATTCC